MVQRDVFRRINRILRETTPIFFNRMNCITTSLSLSVELHCKEYLSKLDFLLAERTVRVEDYAGALVLRTAIT